MSEFSNEVIRNMYTSQYVASWVNAGGNFDTSVDYDENGKVILFLPFRRWLEHLVIDGCHLDPKEIQHIVNYASNGKLELEEDAKFFIAEMKVSERSKRDATYKTILEMLNNL